MFSSNGSLDSGSLLSGSLENGSLDSGSSNLQDSIAESAGKLVTSMLKELFKSAS